MKRVYRVEMGEILIMRHFKIVEATSKKEAIEVAHADEDKEWVSYDDMAHVRHLKPKAMIEKED